MAEMPDYDLKNPRCDQEQLAMLKCCSELGNMSKWNNWREANPDIEIYLQIDRFCKPPYDRLENLYLKGINLSNAHIEGSLLNNINLEDADLSNAHFRDVVLTNVFFSENTNTQGAHFEGSNLENFINTFGKIPICSYEQLKMLKDCSEREDTSIWNNWCKRNIFREIYLQKACLDFFKLKNINLKNGKLEGASLAFADLSYSNLNEAKLMEADISGTIFKGASLFGANLENAEAKTNGIIENDKELTIDFSGACLRAANLSNINLWKVNLEKAILWYSVLEGTAITGDDKGLKANLNGADFTGAIVNGKTIIQACNIDEKTNFSTVGLDSARIEPELLTALKTNIRHIRWEKYFKKHGKSCPGKIATAPMRLFWWLSDYGSSSSRIFISIVIAIFFFTDLYLICSIKAPEGLSFSLNMSNMSEFSCIFVRYIGILCFAIATMVTLGFGNINVGIVPGAPGNTIFVFIVVTLNLVLGYLFLSLIVTRFGILFQSIAPQQKLQKKDNIRFYYCAYILFIFGLSYLIVPILYSLHIIFIIIFCEIFSLGLYFLLKLLFEFGSFLIISFKHKRKLWLRFIKYKMHTKKHITKKH